MPGQGDIIEARWRVKEADLIVVNSILIFILSTLTLIHLLTYLQHFRLWSWDFVFSAST